MSYSPAQLLAQAPEHERQEFLASLDPAEIASLMDSWELFLARPEQLPPDIACRWWALLTGRGFGKNRSASEWFVDRCEAFADANWPHLAVLINQTYDDVSSVQIHGESGIEPVVERRGHRLHHSGSSLHGTLKIRRRGYVHTTNIEVHTAERPDKVRGRNVHTAHADEVAAWTHKVDNVGNTAFTNLDLALRAECPAGMQPMGCVTTTPKPIPQVRDIVAGNLGGKTVITRGSLYDNIANLAPEYVAAVMARYVGTRIEEQELLGKVLDFVEGALWNPDILQQHRLIPGRDEIPKMRKVIVGVDPSGSDKGDECGIVVVGLGADRVMTRLPSGLILPMSHIYVLEDVSVARRPAVWVPRVCETARKWDAEVVAETNFGAKLVIDSIHQVDPMVVVHEVRASKGKAVRAEPVAMVYDQGRAHHVGYFSQLEEQQSTWTPDDDYSPDRMDALVWAVSWLLPEITQPPSRDVAPDDLMGSLPTGADAARRGSFVA